LDYLVAVVTADFTFLLKQTELTRGNLSTHISGWKRRGMSRSRRNSSTESRAHSTP
jgi:hypothetical protein